MIERLLAVTDAGWAPTAEPVPAVAIVSATAALERTAAPPAPGAAPAARLDLQNGGRWIV